MSSSTPSGLFVETFFHNMAYQPDDATVDRIFETDLDPSFTVTINGKLFTRAEYIKSIVDARQHATFKLKKSEELLASAKSDDQNLHAVGHLQEFDIVPKNEGGKVTTITTLTTALVRVEGERRRLVGLTEVTKEA